MGSCPLPVRTLLHRSLFRSEGHRGQKRSRGPPAPLGAVSGHPTQPPARSRLCAWSSARPRHHVGAINKPGKAPHPALGIARGASVAPWGGGRHLQPGSGSPRRRYLGAWLVMQRKEPPFRLFQGEIAEVTVSTNPPLSAARPGVPARQAGEQRSPWESQHLCRRRAAGGGWREGSPGPPFSPALPPRGAAECNK